MRYMLAQAQRVCPKAEQSWCAYSLGNDKIDVTSLKSGMYFIKLVNTKTGVVVGTEKFVKE